MGSKSSKNPALFSGSGAGAVAGAGVFSDAGVASGPAGLAASSSMYTLLRIRRGAGEFWQSRRQRQETARARERLLRVRKAALEEVLRTGT